MEMVKINDYMVTYQRQGNDRNGNPIWIINVFRVYDDQYININSLTKCKLDKYGNIKSVSYSIKSTINAIINNLK